jgi:hypothetical protein
MIRETEEQEIEVWPKVLCILRIHALISLELRLRSYEGWKVYLLNNIELLDTGEYDLYFGI